MGGDIAPDARNAGNTVDCEPTKFFGGTTGWPIALRVVGAVLVLTPVWPGGALTRFFALGLIIRTGCCSTPRRGNTGGATVSPASIGTFALLDTGFVPLTPFPLAPLLLEP